MPPCLSSCCPREVRAMTRAFKVICSGAAAVELSDEERTDIVKRVMPLAYERDRGVHEGLMFSFDIRGKEWSVVVDLGECWVKILGKDELEKAMKAAVESN